MNILQYLFVFLFSSAVSLTALILIFLNIDPTTAGAGAFIIFYSALFFFLSTFFTAISTTVRYFKQSNLQIEDQIKISLRQSCILAFLIVICLFLTSKESLTWWAILIGISIFAIFEYFALSGIETSE